MTKKLPHSKGTNIDHSPKDGSLNIFVYGHNLSDSITRLRYHCPISSILNSDRYSLYNSFMGLYYLFIDAAFTVMRLGKYQIGSLRSISGCAILRCKYSKTKDIDGFRE
jgi:hypothetical protein